MVQKCFIFPCIARTEPEGNLTMWKVFPEYVLLYEKMKTTQVRIQVIHSVHPSFCIKCIEIIKQFREPAQETASGAMALLTGPVSCSKVCSLGRKIVLPSAIALSPGSFRLMQGKLWPIGGRIYHTFLSYVVLIKIQLIKA